MKDDDQKKEVFSVRDLGSLCQSLEHFYSYTNGINVSIELPDGKEVPLTSAKMEKDKLIFCTQEN